MLSNFHPIKIPLTPRFSLKQLPHEAVIVYIQLSRQIMWLPGCCISRYPVMDSPQTSMVEHYWRRIECGDIMIRSVFSQILTTDTPQLAREGEGWCVCCEVKVWYTFCHCHRSAMCNIVINRTAWKRHSTIQCEPVSLQNTHKRHSITCLLGQGMG